MGLDQMMFLGTFGLLFFLIVVALVLTNND